MIFATTFAALDRFVRASAVKVEVRTASETRSTVVDARSLSRAAGERLDVAAALAWLEAQLAAVLEPIDALSITTLAVEVRAPAWVDGRGTFVLEVDGETRWLIPWESGGSIWLESPGQDVPVPLEIELLGYHDGWRLDVNLIWSLWERDWGEFEPELEECARAIEAAGWSAW